MESKILSWKLKCMYLPIFGIHYIREEESLSRILVFPAWILADSFPIWFFRFEKLTNLDIVTNFQKLQREFEQIPRSATLKTKLVHQMWV